MTWHSFYPLHRARQLAREVRHFPGSFSVSVHFARALESDYHSLVLVKVAPYRPHQHRHPFSRCATCELGAWRTGGPTLHSRCWRQKTVWANIECGDNIHLPPSVRGSVFIRARDGRGGTMKGRAWVQENPRGCWGEKRILWSRANVDAWQSGGNVHQDMIYSWIKQTKMLINSGLLKLWPQ